MKYATPPRHSLTLAASAIAAVGLLLTAGLAQAQTTKTIKGHFHSSDGNRGTYIETVDTNGDVVTDTVVYTRQSDKETSTDISIVTGKDTGTGTYTVAFSHTDYGTTAAFTSMKTVVYVKGEGHVGNGTYTNADGVAGTFRTLEYYVKDIKIESSAYVPSTGTGTNELRVEEDALGFKTVRTLTVAPDDKITSVDATFHRDL
jgi:hypothetical protein